MYYLSVIVSWALSVDANFGCGREEVRDVLAYFSRNCRQLISNLHPPPIGTVRPKIKRKRMESTFSWNCTKLLLQRPRQYPYNISYETSLLLVYCEWSQRLMILYFHLAFIKSLFIDKICHFIIMAVVVSLFAIILITSFNRTHNCLGSLQRETFDFWILCEVIVEKRIVYCCWWQSSDIWDRFLNLCWYCWGEVSFPYNLLGGCVLSESNRWPASGHRSYFSSARDLISKSSPISGCLPYQSFNLNLYICI